MLIYRPIRALSLILALLLMGGCALAEDVENLPVEPQVEEQALLLAAGEDLPKEDADVPLDERLQADELPQAPCAHAATEERVEPLEGAEYLATGDPFAHTCTGSYLVRLFCADCGAELTNEPGALLSADEQADGVGDAAYPMLRSGSATQPHTFVEGVCAACGYAAKVSLPAKITMGVKQQLAAGAAFDNPDGATDVVFASSDEKIARVDPDTGVITARKKGTATITVKAANGTKAKAKVKVRKAPKSIKLDRDGLSLGSGERAKLLYKLTSGSATQVTWTTSDAGVVDVAPDGSLLAAAPGTATVTAATHVDGVADSCQVTVLAAPGDEDVSIDAPLALGVGEKGAAVPRLAEGTCGALALSCEGGCLKLDPRTGALKGLKPGTAVITATAYNGASASVSVEVMPGPERVTIVNAPKVLCVGQTFGLDVLMESNEGDCAGAITFSSSDKSVLKLDKRTGLLTAKGTGIARITAKAYNKVKASVKIKVYKPPKSVKLDRDDMTLGLGEQRRLSPILPKNRYSPISFETADANVATVDADGRVTAVGLGQTTVTAAAMNGVSAACAVTVLGAPDAIELPRADLLIFAGEKVANAAQVTCAGQAWTGEVTYTSTDPSVAKVSQSGKITALATGETTIVATTYNGLEASTTVLVGGSCETGGDKLMQAVRGQVERLEWFDAGDKAWKRNQYGYLYDIKTGIMLRVKRMGGYYHADVEPVTKKDTKLLRKIAGGSFGWESHACILIANGRYMVCAINTKPHGRQTISTNGYNGQFCLHMVGSITHGSGKVNQVHQANIERAWKWANA